MYKNRNQIALEQRHGWRKHNSNFKPLLVGLGFRKTDTTFLKDWISNRAHLTANIEDDEFPIKVCYGNMVGCFKTWAEACYQVAIIEKKKGNRI